MYRILLVVAIAILIYREIHHNNDEKKILALHDNELIRWQGKDSSNNVKYQVIEHDAILKIKSKDSIINRLQKKVRKYGKKSIVTSFNTKTIIKETIDTVTIVKYDKDSFPVYKGSIKTNWVDAELQCFKDSINLDLGFYDEYDIIVGKDKLTFKTLFKKRNTYAIITNRNPHSKTSDAKTYYRDRHNKKFIIGPNVGISAAFDGKTITPSIVVGIGITYKLFEF